MSYPNRLWQAATVALLGAIALGVVVLTTSAFADPSDNEAPVGVDDSAATLQDTPIEIDVLANDTDPDEDPLQVAAGALARASILDAAPLLLWECYPAGGGVVVDRSGNGNIGAIAGAQAGDLDADCDGANAFLIPESGGVVAASVPSMPVGAAPRSFLVRFQAGNQLAGAAGLFSVGTNDAFAEQFTISRDWDNSQLLVTSWGNDTIAPLPIANLADGNEHTLVVTYDGNLGVTVWVDGVAGPTADLFVPLNTTGTSVQLGQALFNTVGANDQIRQFAMFDGVLDEATIIGLHSAIQAAAAGQAFTQPANGTVTSNGQTVTYTPNPGFFGTDTFTYSVSDGEGASASASVTVQVTAGVLAVQDDVNTTTGESITFNAMANDVIPEGVTASIIEVEDPANGTATTDGQNIEYTPDEGFIGTDTFTYTIESNEGNTSTGTINVVVTPDNQWPTAVDDSATTPLGQAIHIPVIDNDTDPDGNDVYVSPGQLARGAILRQGPLLHWECLPESLPDTLLDTSGNGRDGAVGEGVTPGAETGDCDNGTSMVFAGAGGVITRDNPGLPIGQQARSALVRYKSNAGTVLPADIPLFGYGQNGTPYAQFSVSRTILGNDKLIFTSWANDLHFELPPGSNIADGNEHNIMFVYDGNVTVYAYYDGIPSGQGTLAVPLQTIDDTVMLGQSPWGWQGAGDELRQFAIFPIAISEDDAYLVHAAIEAAVLNKSFTDPRFGTVVEDPDHLGFTYTPDPGYVGPDQFLYSISDGHGGGAIALVSVDVLPGVAAVNDSEVVTPDEPLVIDVLGNDSAQPGANLTIIGVTQGAHGTVTTDGSTVTYTPNSGYVGLDTFQYTVESDQGGTGTALVTVDVGGTGGNLAPIAVDDDVTTDFETPITVNVLSNDYDPDGDPIVISDGSTAVPGIMAYDPILLWSCMPPGGGSTMVDQSENGRNGVIHPALLPGVAADDCGGGTAIIFPNGNGVTRANPGLPAGSAARSFSVRYRSSVNGNLGIFGQGANTTPLGQFSISRGAPDQLVFASWGNDTIIQLAPGTDLGDGNEHTLVVVYDGATTLTAYVDGVAGTPATIAPLNTVDDIVILGNTVWGAVGGGAQMRHFAVFDRALDASEAAGLHDAIESVVGGDAYTQGQHGSVTQTGNSLVYTPVTGFSGTDDFTYTISDGNGGSSTATVTVTVEDSGAMAVDDTAVTTGTTPVVIDVLANDIGAASVFAVGLPEHGVANANPDNTITYQAAPGFVGADSFEYTMTDGSEVFVAVVTVTVLEPVNSAPVAVDDDAETDAGSPVSIDVLANDYDPDILDTIFISPGGTAIDSLNALEPSLYWACLPESGSIVDDQSGNGLDGTIQGNVAAGDIAGDCGGATPVFVDGSALILNVSGTGLPTGADARTLVVRFRSGLPTPSDVGLFGYGTNALGLGQFSIARSSAGNDRLVFASWGNDHVLMLPPGSDLADGDEHTIAVVYDGANTLTAWFDGVAGAATTIAPLQTVNSQVMLGQTLYGAVSAGAEMRHFAIYADDLSPSAIESIHEAIENSAGGGAFTQGANGSVTQDGDELVYSPNPGFFGTDSFQYTISDGNDAYATATVTVTVLAVPLAAEDDSASTQQDTPVTIPVLDNDAGVNLSVAAVTDGANGTVTTDGTTVTYTPAPGFWGTDTFTVDVTDGSETQTVTVTVTVNGLPTGTDLSESTDVDVPVTIPVIPTITDPEGGPLQITGVGIPSNGSVTIDGDDVMYTPAPGFEGVDSFTVTVVDDAGGSVTITVTVTVTGNTPPTVVDDTATTNSPSPVTINVLANDSDIDGDTLQINSAVAVLTAMTPDLYWACLPDSGSVVPDQSGNGQDGQIVGNVVAGVVAGDCGGATPIFADGSALILNTTGTVLPSGSAARTLVVRFRTSLATPSDVGLFGYGTNAAPNGQFSIARTSAGNDRLLFASWGNDNILHLPPGSNLADGDEHTLVVTYDGLNTITGWFDGVAGSPTTIAQLNTVISQVMLGQTLYGAVSAGAAMRHYAIYDGVLDGAQIAAMHAAIEAGASISYTQPANGTVTRDGNNLVYTPNAGFVGTDTFSYTASDGMGGTGSATVTVTVEPPLIEAVDDTASTQQGDPVTVPVLDNDAGDELTVVGTTDGANGTVTTDGTTVTYTPAPGFYGTDTFTVTIEDEFGNQQTSTVTVSVNAPPQGTDLDDETEPETPVTISIVPPVIDPEGGPLVITSAGPAGNGTVTIDDGNVVYTPNTGFIGFDTFEVTIEDGDGGSLTITVTVAVFPPLTTLDDTAFTQQGVPVEIYPLDNDGGFDLEVVSASIPANGVSEVLSSGLSVMYYPGPGFWGTDTFTITVQDGNGDTQTSTVTVTVNGLPVGDDIEDETAPETPVTIPVIGGFTDPEGGDLTITSAGPAGNGTVTIDGDDVVYTPAPGFIGTDTFEVTVTDEDGGSTTITVTVVVATPLEVVDDTAFTQQGDPVTAPVLDNDAGDLIVVTSTTDGANGTVTTDGTTVTYTPAPGFWGTDTFTVTVTDAYGETGTSTVTVTVNGAPVGDDIDDTTEPETPVTISIVPPVTDPEDGPLVITSAGPATNGTVTIDDGNVIYTPNTGFIGTDTFEVTITDEDGGTTTITVTVLVATPLVVTPDTAFTQQDTPVTVPVLDNDEGDELVVTSTTDGANGTVTTDGTTVTYTPALGFWGTDTFTVTVTDAHGNTETATVTVTVNGLPFGDDIDGGITQPETPISVPVVPTITDPEGGPLVITSAGPATNGTVTIEGDDVIYTPDPGFTGTDTFEVTITDEDGGSVTITVTVHVNAPPTGSDVATFTQQDEPIGIGILSSVDDPDGDDLEITGVTQPANGTVTFDSGSVTYTPAPGFSGIDTFTVTVEDEHGAPVTITVTVTVNGTPVGEDLSESTSEDTPVDIDILGTITDPDGDDLEITDVTDPSNGVVTVVDGVATYTPNAGFTGTDTFEVTVEDGNGGSVTITVTVTVTGAPRIILSADACVAVVVKGGDAGYTSEFWLEGPGAPTFLGLTNRSPIDTQMALGTYPAGTELILSIHVTDTGHVFMTGAGTNNPDGMVHVALTPGTGDVLTTVGFEDLFNGGDQDYNDALVDVVAIDCAIDAGADEATTSEDEPVTVDVLANDSTEQGTLVIDSVTQGANGSVSTDGETVTYTPNAGFSGTDTFTYTVTNGLGVEETQTVTITVLATPRIILSADACVAVVPQGGSSAYLDQFWFEGPGTPTALGIDNTTPAGSVTVPVGPFTAGTELMLSIHVTNTGEVFQTGPASGNSDNTVHATVTPGTGDVLYTVAFEDLLNGGDLDFNDAVLDVLAVDCAVVGVDDAAATVEDTPVTVAVLDNDTTDFGTLVVTSVTPGANGTTTTDGTTVTYTANPGFVGTDTFTYTVENGAGGVDTPTVTITVNPAPRVVLSQDACVAVVPQGGSSAYLDQFWFEGPGTPTSLGLDNTTPAGSVTVPVGFFTAGTELVLSIHVTNTGEVFQTGPASNNPDNVIHASVTPGVGDVLYSVHFEDLLGGGDLDFNDAWIDVVAIDCAVAGIDDTAETPEGDSVEVSVLDNDSTDVGTLSVTEVTQGTNGTVTTDGTTVTYTPNPGYAGTDTFTYTAANGYGGTATVTVTVTIAPAPRVILSADACLAMVVQPSSAGYTSEFWLESPDTPVYLGATNHDVGARTALGTFTAGTELVFSIHVTNTGLVFQTGAGSDNPDGLVHVNLNPSIVDVLYRVGFEDLYGGGDLDFDDAVFDLLEINCDVVPADDAVTTTEDVPVTVSVLDNDAAEEGTLAVTSVTDGAHGTVTTDGTTATYTPAAGFHGTDTFTYTVENGLGGSGIGVVTVTVNPLPTVVDDTATSNSAPVTVSVLDNDDGIGNPLTVTGVTNGSHGSASTDGTSVTYTPNPGFVGTDTFTYTVNNGFGTATANVTVQVLATNRVVLAANGCVNLVTRVSSASYTDTFWLMAPGTPENLGVTNKSAVGSTVSLGYYTAGTELVFGIKTNIGAYTWVTGPAASNPDNFQHAKITTGTSPVLFQVDFEDLPNGGDNDFNDANFNVVSVPCVLTAVDDAAATAFQTAVTVSVLANDTVTAEPGSVTSVTQGAHGTVSTNGTTATYTPATGFIGTDTFTYTVTDVTGATATATVTVQVSGQPPVAVDDSAHVAKNGYVYIDVLANDSDPDNDTLQIVSVTQPGSGNSKGTVTIVGNQVKYTPKYNQTGSVTFTYTVGDGHGGTATATVTVTIGNRAPVAVDDTATTKKGSTVYIDVLANDSDPDGDDIEIDSIGSIPSWQGSASISYGKIKFKPKSNFTGTVTFTYTIEDEDGAQATATVTVNVVPNQAPVAVDDSATTPKNTVVYIDVLANDSDPDGDHDDLEISSIGSIPSSKGSASVSGGKIKFTPKNNYTGTVTFTYTVEDADGGTATATVTVVVGGSAVNTAGKMTGGGQWSISGQQQRNWGFNLRCDGGNSHINFSDNHLSLHVNIGASGFSSLVCTDNPSINNGKDFDTVQLTATGSGSLNGNAGTFTLIATLTDGGSNASSDTFVIVVKNSSGVVVDNISGNLNGGNHEAHNN